MRNFIFPLIIIVFTFGCSTKQKQQHALMFVPDNSIHYAKGFRVSRSENIIQVEVIKPYQGADAAITYWLVPANQTVPHHSDSIKIIRTPISRIVCTSTTHIPLLEYLNEENSLVGFPSTEYISAEKIRARIDEGKVVDVGVDKGMNLEVLATLRPDLVMAYTMTGDYGQFKKMEDLKIPVALNAEYLEEHPLGRAEWIKFMALFFNKEAKADSVFSSIEKNYLQIKSLIDTIEFKEPTVISGIVYGDTWFMPGGNNYAAKLLSDAGFNYLWKNDSSSGFLQISFEAVYAIGEKADYWIGVGSYNSLAEIKKADSRYSNFKAFKQKQVYSNDARKGAKGGSEMLELGYLRPDIILKDLVNISHPQLLQDTSLFFHKRLQ